MATQRIVWEYTPEEVRDIRDIRRQLNVCLRDVTELIHKEMNYDEIVNDIHKQESTLTDLVSYFIGLELKSMLEDFKKEYDVELTVNEDGDDYIIMQNKSSMNIRDYVSDPVLGLYEKVYLGDG